MDDAEADADADAKEDAKAARKRIFFRVRVSLLLVILAGVLVYAWRDVRSRRARNDFTRTLDVGILLTVEDAVDPAAIAAVERRAGALAARLTAERRRYDGDAAIAPFAFHVLGPVHVDGPPAAPTPASEGEGTPGPIDAVKASIALAKWTSDVDGRIGVAGDAYDIRVYIVARRPTSAARTLVEGSGEQGGRVGVVEVELDESMADFALIVAAHEMLHTLGAEDEYDAAGRAKVPGGLAEPERGDRQRFVEIMARNRPIGGGREAVPESIDEIAVGATTARAIGW